MGSRAHRVIWGPQPGPQSALVNCPHPVIFFGGARGGGKTDGVLGKWALKAAHYGNGFNAVMFRKTTVSSDDAIERAREIYEPLGAIWGQQALRFRMPGGGRISFRYLDSVSDAEQYQGKNVSDAWVEEIGQYWNSEPIDKLFGVLRSTAGVPTQLICTGNPGGAGQGWIADRFELIPLPQQPKVVRKRLHSGDFTAAVIPSRIQDNQILMRADPGYVNRLRMSGSDALVAAWLEGDWNRVDGAFFDCWSSSTVLTPFVVPKSWSRFLAFDWGSAAPFCTQWWAIAQTDYLHQGQRIPRGALICYREWYGASAPNKGLKLTAEEVAKGILETDDSVRVGYADPAIFAEDGGPSIAERMRPIIWRRADNKRVARNGAMGGWDQMRARIKDGMLFFFDTCHGSIRTIPVLQHDPAKAEDLDTKAEDHAADTTRYACMSRPYTPRDPDPVSKTGPDYKFNTTEAAQSWKTV